VCVLGSRSTLAAVQGDQSVVRLVTLRRRVDSPRFLPWRRCSACRRTTTRCVLPTCPTIPARRVARPHERTVHIVTDRDTRVFRHLHLPSPPLPIGRVFLPSGFPVLTRLVRGKWPGLSTSSNGITRPWWLNGYWLPQATEAESVSIMFGIHEETGNSRVRYLLKCTHHQCNNFA